MAKIIIHVSGGCVTDVYASEEVVLDVHVLDEDNAKEETDPQARADNDTLREEIQGMVNIW